MKNDKDRTPRFVTSAATVLEYCGALLLFLMMGLTFVDVIGRYLFSSPVPGGFEITEVMLATLIFCGLPLITLRDGHITVDLIENFLPDWFRVFRDRLVFMLGAVLLAYLCWRLWHKAGDMVAFKDQTAVLNIPLYPVCYAMSILSGMSSLIALILGFVGHRGKRDDVAVDV